MIGDERFFRRVVCTLPMKCKQTKTIHQTLLHQRDKKVRVGGAIGVLQGGERSEYEVRWVGQSDSVPQTANFIEQFFLPSQVTITVLARKSDKITNQKG